MRRQLAASVLLVLVASTGCTPGPYPFDFFQEMHYTQVQRRDEPNRAPPPSDSVPLSGRPTRLSFAQASQLSSPLAVDGAAIAHGRLLADVHCAVCHGPGGSGQPSALLAPYFQSNPAAPVAPVAFNSARMQNRTDGQLYWIIARGLGNMPAFRGVLSSDDLWTLVAFIRQQTSQ